MQELVHELAGFEVVRLLQKNPALINWRKRAALNSGYGKGEKGAKGGSNLTVQHGTFTFGPSGDGTNSR